MIDNIKYNKGYDCYVVNDNGDIHILYKGQDLKQYTKVSNTGRNYYIVNLKGHEQYVHILTAFAFHEEQYWKFKQRGIKPVVDHIDNNPYNNSPDNLEWVTRSENALRSVQYHKQGE